MCIYQLCVCVCVHICSVNVICCVSVCVCFNVICCVYGLFGQCRTSKLDQVQYQVSVPVLKRMQEVLKQLTLQGLSWQDDITQYIVTKELSRVPHTPRPSKTSSSHSSSNRGGYPSSSSNQGGYPSQADSHQDYMIVDHAQFPLRIYQEDVERSLHQGGGVYPGPRPSFSSRSQQAKQRERDRQLLQDVISLYLSSSPAQPSFRHRGAAALPASPYYEDLELPLDYVEDYSLTEQDMARQQQQQKKIRLLLQQQKKKVPQDYSSLAGLDESILQRMVETLEMYGVDPRDLTPQQLYRLAVVLQRMKADDQENAGTTDLRLSLSVCLVVGPALTFRIRQNPQNMSAEDVAEKAVSEKTFLESETGLKILQTGVGERSEGHGLPHATRVRDGSSGLVLTLVSMACVGGVVVVALTIACLRHHTQQPASGKLGLGPEGGPETHFDYQELCRQHMAAKTSLSRQEAVGVGAGGRRGTDTSRVSSVSSQFSDGPQHSPSSHSSTPSWSEEPAQSKMDISTGHMILAYMEDHLKDKDRLMKEWNALCSYQAEPSAVTVGQSESQLEKNRCPESLPYDHSRVKLKAESNSTKEDYINASIIIDHDPRLPAYIATQGPLAHTIADFWQMVWENGCTVIVMMTALVEDGETQCVRYWPDEGSSLYHIYEVNLVSEHIWCKDFLVRSFYLKNVQTQETRTLTQFHLLSWPANGIPTSTRPLLDFRRKVNRCYRGRSCPIIVHCSDGTGRTGTYILIDMVINRMAKGAKEIDIAATLEHIRDQRPSLVHTKDQFEFALTAVAEEVNAILKALPQ
uniref:Protein tyrosine phosphatase receptor type Na n=1 Tax=Oncorhynchus tshawytscha TaxID=74940 RepID=A0AAZ3R1W9_ONCTS